MKTLKDAELLTLLHSLDSTLDKMVDERVPVEFALKLLDHGVRGLRLLGYTDEQIEEMTKEKEPPPTMCSCGHGDDVHEDTVGGGQCWWQDRGRHCGCERFKVMP